MRGLRMGPDGQRKAMVERVGLRKRREGGKEGDQGDQGDDRVTE